MTNGAERLPEHQTAATTDTHEDPWAGFTGESPEEAAYAEGWKDAREHDNFTALRDRIVALEAVIAGARTAAQPTPNGEPLRERIIAVLDLSPSTVLIQMIREAKAEAWDEGRESVGLDMTKPLGSDGQRRATANPYRNGDA